jgi:poly-gamma-glutamate capsule biosynthesis protein CapA/YwtB (metallophosphatase superfamily)
MTFGVRSRARPGFSALLAIEGYRDRLILYGCGDFLNDYEGIKGYEEFR